MIARRRTGALALMGVAAATLIGHAGSGWRPAPRQAPTFRSGVNLVKVDVSVLDKQNQPVRDLTAKDFVLNEDGKPQQIQAFTPIDLPEPPATGAAWTRAVAPDVQSNTGADADRLVVVVIDDAVLPQVPLLVVNSKTIAKSVIEQMGPADLAAVVFTRNAGHSQEFTHDRAPLLAAIEATASSGYEPGTSPANSSAEAGSVEASLDALTHLAEVLGSVPDRRKAVVWISIGVPASPWETSTVGWQKELHLRWVAAMDAVRRANVNVFTVDPGGLDGLRSAGGTAFSAAGRPSGFNPGLDPNAVNASMFRRYLQGLADATGGRAFVNSNEVETKVGQILRETGSFYLLGYVSSNLSTDGRLRKIQVKVKRPNVTIRSRSEYYPSDSDLVRAAAAAAPASPVVAALSGLLPRRDLPIQVAAAAFTGPDDPAFGAIVIAATVRAPASQVTGVDVLFEAIGSDGKLAASQHARATGAAAGPGTPATGAAGPGEAIDLDASARLDVPSGHYQLRTAAGGGTLGIGSVYGDIDVPVFQKIALAWSGAIVGRAGDRRSTLGPIVPITPRTNRTFAPTGDAAVFARLYQGGAGPVQPATVRLRIVDEKDAVKMDQSETIPPERFGTARAADVLRVIPLSRLMPGNYLLLLEAVAGTNAGTSSETSATTVKRQVRFEVR